MTIAVLPARERAIQERSAEQMEENFENGRRGPPKARPQRVLYLTLSIDLFGRWPPLYLTLPIIVCAGWCGMHGFVNGRFAEAVIQRGNSREKGAFIWKFGYLSICISISTYSACSHCDISKWTPQITNKDGGTSFDIKMSCIFARRKLKDR